LGDGPFLLDGLALFEEFSDGLIAYLKAVCAMHFIHATVLIDYCCDCCKRFPVKAVEYGVHCGLAFALNLGTGVEAFRNDGDILEGSGLANSGNEVHGFMCLGVRLT